MLLQTQAPWWSSALNRSRLNLLQDTSRFFEPRLVEIGLGEEQIASQDLKQLRASLDRVNDAIAHSDGFGFFKVTAEGQVLGTMKSAEAHIGALPVLIQRKKSVVDRIALLESEANVNDLRSLAGQAEPSLRAELEARINNLENQRRAQARDLEAAQQQAQLAQQVEIARIEVFERRSRVWQSFLERQSVATIVGAVLLIAIFVYIVLASSSGAKAPELINNAFLVILGIFSAKPARDRRSIRIRPNRISPTALP